MTQHLTARHDPELQARIVRRVPMRYQQEADSVVDRPPYVRAASGLTWFRDYLAVVQDDSNWLALIDTDDSVHAVPLPPDDETGERVFDSARGNKHRKIDLEACITVPGENGHELIAFGSGSHTGREWILRVHEGTPITPRGVRHAHGGPDVAVHAEFLPARALYEHLRARTDFAGAGLNLEGAVPLDDGDTIVLFNRGNAPAAGGLSPVDATARLSWRAVNAHLRDPQGVAPPELTGIRQYALGTFDGVRLTFSDAEDLGDAWLYSASAEDPATDAITGSALGVIEAGGEARWATVYDERGEPFRGKIEGLSRAPGKPGRVHFVIDDDDETVPSEYFEAELHGPWPVEGGA